MIITDILGWIGNIFFILGLIFISQKNMMGFVCCIIANALYVGQSMILDNISLFWLSILLIILNIYSIYNWRIMKKKKTTTIPQYIKSLGISERYRLLKKAKENKKE